MPPWLLPCNPRLTQFLKKLPLLGALIPRPPEIIPHTTPFEEETATAYSVDKYFPVEIDAVLDDRYRVLGKLGYGTNATVWLCMDLPTKTTKKSYVVVKVGTRNSGQALREAVVFNYIRGLRTSHPGAQAIRTMLHSFRLSYRDGMYFALVHPPLAMSLRDLRLAYPDFKVPVRMMQFVLRHILLGLSFLHEHGIVHTDIQEGNIMFEFANPDVLRDFTRRERLQPSARKLLPSSTIYASRSLHWEFNFSTPILSDFGLARYGQVTYTDARVQPLPYQAPEVLLGIPWARKVDVWNVGCFVFHMLFKQLLFDGDDDAVPRTWDNRRYLDGVAGTLGPPPREMLAIARANVRPEGEEGLEKTFSEEAYWVGRSTQLVSLRRRVQMAGLEEPELLVEFLEMCVEWRPEERMDMAQLLDSRWMTAAAHS
ncbi:kinase-like domain-containing protein [Massariosphaeria phaeospora]|uniref:Kinase-like domain-containing protein n=1 Tax=Massariosphaeria phaeospora TaxID=100035 RepID=A0A7C8MC85_9PLEO|nr:kinase-like domain-containing protein [Massariosphaeria phaeospora]